MTSLSVPSIGSSIITDIESFALSRALARLDDPADGGALSPALAGILRSRALMGLEQWRTAYDVLQAVRKERELSGSERVEAQLRTATVLRCASASVDHALEMALAAAEQAERAGANGLAVDARLEAARLYARKRCRKLTEGAIAAARALGVHLGRVEATAGDLSVHFDSRPDARDAYERAIALGAGLGRDAERAASVRLGRLGLARLHTVLGEFDTAVEQLVALGDPLPEDLPVRRAAWRLWASRADWSKAATALAGLVDASPRGDGARSLQLERAAALYRASDIEGARGVWTTIAASGDGDWASRTAARALDKLGGTATRRTRLQAFPSVTQLRNHCGPASVELCMRFFGNTAAQVDIAREIKHPDGGTPVHRMRQYMDAAGFHTRRVEADLDRLRAILDRGIPVIIEEDYSTSRHVAVAIGYDDRREILEVQDPMTHEIRETGYDELPRLREFSNHGALVAVPASRADLIAALDEAGAVECAYMSTTDLAWEAHDHKRDEDAERLCSEAIAQHEAYELAWVLRFVRADARRFEKPGPENDRAVQEVLDVIVRLWPNDEWPQQFIGRVRDSQNRTDEALAAFERARDRDPDDAGNWCAIGDCRLQRGERDAARSAWEDALRRDPGHVRSNENLSDLSFDFGETALASILNDCALELAPTNAFNWHVRGRILGSKNNLDPAIEAYDRVLEIRPESSGFAVERARLLARRGDVDPALEALQALSETRAHDTFLLTNLADLAYTYERHGLCVATCDRFAAVDAKSPTPLAIGGAARCMRGELDEGLLQLREALRRRPTYAWAHREIARALADAGRYDEAITECAANLGLASSPDATYRLGDVMARAGYHGDGSNYLRKAARSGSLGRAQLDRVADAVLFADGGWEAHQFFCSLAQERPHDLAIAQAHVYMLLECMWAPGSASAVLTHLGELAPDDPWVLANTADELMWGSPAGEARGEALFGKAIAAAPSLVAPRRLFARQLNARGRFAEALDVLAPCPVSAETLGDRVHALLGLDRETEANAAIEAWVASAPDDRKAAWRGPLAYQVAHAMQRWDEALALSTKLAVGAGELDDDGKLGRWEASRFECMVELGQMTEALAFGAPQCGAARDLGRLAVLASEAVDPSTARTLAERGHAMDPNETSCLTTLARLADREGDLERARGLWLRMKAVSAWHVHDENLGRLAMADGDLATARTHLDAAATAGHTCAVALQLRAELALLEGDRDRARTDAERARGCRRLADRGRSWMLEGLLAGLADDAAAARTAFGMAIEHARSDSDRRRITALSTALGLG